MDIVVGVFHSLYLYINEFWILCLSVDAENFKFFGTSKMLGIVTIIIILLGSIEVPSKINDKNYPYGTPIQAWMKFLRIYNQT